MKLKEKVEKVPKSTVTKSDSAAITPNYSDLEAPLPTTKKTDQKEPDLKKEPDALVKVNKGKTKKKKQLPPPLNLPNLLKNPLSALKNLAPVLEEKKVEEAIEEEKEEVKEEDLPETETTKEEEEITKENTRENTRW